MAIDIMLVKSPLFVGCLTAAFARQTTPVQAELRAEWLDTAVPWRSGWLWAYETMKFQELGFMILITVLMG